MKLQLRKMPDGFLAMTDDEGEILPGQVSVQIIAEKVIVEFGLWGDGIELSNEPTKTGHDREHQ